MAVSSESGYELLGASVQELKTSVKRKEDKTRTELVGKVLDPSIAVLARRQNHQVAPDYTVRANLDLGTAFAVGNRTTNRLRPSGRQ